MASAAVVVEDDDSFDERVAARRVDLIKRIEEGVPPLEYLPRAEGMFVRGKRHLIPGPKKAGKSIAMLVQWVYMALADATIVVFDRENGADEYASRLDDIITAWNLGPKMKKRLAKNLQYYAFPHFKLTDGPALRKLALNADIVAFDATRMFLTDLGLNEDSADDYSVFMASLIDPLAEANVASVILDNTGHGNKSRARATSAKGDLNEVLFTFEKVDPFTLKEPGKVRLSIADSRFGNEGTWEMHIGGGAFMPWQRTDDQKPVNPEFRRAVESVLAAAGRVGLSGTKVIEQVRERGVTVRNEIGREWLARLAADPAVKVWTTPPEKKGQPQLFFGSREAGRGTPDGAEPGAR